jgi:hypothetical protein
MNVAQLRQQGPPIQEDIKTLKNRIPIQHKLYLLLL